MDIKRLNEEINTLLESETDFTFAECFGKDLTGETYNEDVKCINKGLTSLKGAPTKINGIFDCSNNNLSSLQYGPQYVSSYYCQNNELESLEGAPKEVDNYFNCSNNPLKTFKGLPKKIKTLVAEGLDYRNIDLNDLKQSQIDNIIPKTLNAVVKETTLGELINDIIKSANKGYKKYATNRINKGTNFANPENALGFFSFQNIEPSKKQYNGKLVSSNLDATVLESIVKSINKRFNPFTLEINDNTYTISW